MVPRKILENFTGFKIDIPVYSILTLLGEFGRWAQIGIFLGCKKVRFFFVKSFLLDPTKPLLLNKPWISGLLSLQRSERSSLPTYPLPVHPKVPKKPPLLRGEQSEPWISTPLSLERRERSSLYTYPLPVHTKVPKKPPLLRGEQSKPWISTPLSLERMREVPFLHTPYRCIQKCQKKHHFWEASKASPE